MTVTRNLDALQAIAIRLASDASFMGFVLDAYKNNFGVDQSELPKLLKCSSANVLDLRLCRAPRAENDALFLEDVKAISRFSGCDWHEVAKIVRAVQAVNALGKQSGIDAKLLLKAARDRTPGEVRSKRTRKKPTN